MALKKLNTTYATSTKQINYLSKTFVDFRQNLIDFAKVYFPSTYTDFNESSPGMMFIEMAAYVGDVLGYYIDSNFRENLINHASDISTIVPIAQSLGFRPKPTTAAYTTLDVFQIVPAKGIDDQYVPDESYYMIIAPNMVVASSDDASVQFRTLDVINFSDPVDRQITVYSIDNFNRPLFYLIKKRAKVSAGTVRTFTTSITSTKKFTSISIPDKNVLDVISVEDANGNQWKQVDYLAQDLVFEDTLNSTTSTNTNTSPPPSYTFKLIKTNRRYTVRYNSDFDCELHFGSGLLDDLSDSIFLEPNMVATSEYSSGTPQHPLDPSDFLSSKSYGLAPYGEFTIKYVVGGGLNSNVSSNTLNRIISVQLNNVESQYTPSQLAIWNTIKQSLTVNNPDPATGGKDQDSVEEIRQNALAFFNAQNRLVTTEDYISRCFALPARYGGIAKAFVTQEDQINNILRENNNFAPVNGIYVDDIPGQNMVNVYILGYNSNKKIVPVNSQVKENLKKYLDQYRILTDKIRIMDGFVVNIGVRFNITVFRGYNLNEVLARCIEQLKDMFDITKWQINQPIILNDIYMELGGVEGVQNVSSVEVFNRYRFADGIDYNEYIYDISSATVDGVIYPSMDPMIFEVRFPERDIIGGATQ